MREAALELRAGGRARCSPPGDIHVLKFGSSVLACPDDYPVVAEVIGREVACARKVVAVVSAMGDATDSLLAAARSVTPASHDRLMGALLATGEEASVALLALALAAKGVPAAGLNAWRLPVRTRGSLSDAEPVAVDTARIRAMFASHDVVIFPGFIGVDVTGVPSLLGRGGSDLTALFLADALGAEVVRLVKDVDGIFPSDPRGFAGAGSRRDGAPGSHRDGILHPPYRGSTDERPPAAHEPYSTLTWSQAQEIGGAVVQSKAIDFAERRGLAFRVTGLTGKGTTIGERGPWQTAR